ncbi:hypothetical protein [Robbsia andropogonis]|uniref:hypothetical protein n=1 Tax=Robbsia andropogonis TaxID=28092 RepID=UPI002A6B52A0|nr:hypothetical protein [Robbsia andropogonis]
MNLREIQALHAQYARSGTVIDLPAQIARMPLPALSNTSTQRPRGRTNNVSNDKRTGLWLTAMCLGGIALVGLAGAGAGKLWNHLDHHGVSSPAASAPVTAARASVASTVASVVFAAPLTQASVIANVTPLASAATAFQPAPIEPGTEVRQAIEASAPPLERTTSPQMRQVQQLVAPVVATSVDVGAAANAPTQKQNDLAKSATSVHYHARHVHRDEEVAPQPTKQADSEHTESGAEVTPIAQPQNRDVKLF